ncbi:murein biosynthesis integral membrane protein MurJ [Sinomonas sp. ASV322]|uniref:murein biosynthesis integral membrane protein MurJ n=1 Tax=Sinomonas sp. ASV322 TaxID=3041920 RepID=UPI0027DE3087|nr:murein biosynthesis integral membrane protein MurJ [Sinomonas sp. ASV322]MDQ4503929.1 murein biosynthesis integral membrane protein MurJ [Sinomonas sp. ASV322]
MATKAPASEARSSAIMAAGTLLSRVLGFLRQLLLVYALGLGSTVTDTFVNANNLPNLIFLLVAGGVFNTVLVPQIIKASRAADQGADYISRLLTLGVIVTFVLTALVTIGAPIVMRLTTSGYSPPQLALATVFAYWCLPQIFFYGLYALLTQVLNAHGAFGPAMWAPLVNNVVAIAGLGMFIWIFGTNNAHQHTLDNWGTPQTLLVAGASTVGVVIQTAMLFIPVARLGLGLRPRFGWRGVGLGAAARIGAWTLATTAVGQLTFLYLMRVASMPGAAREQLREANDPLWQFIPGNTVLEMASQLYLLPHSIIALSLATVLFNRMTEASQSGDRRGVRIALSSGLRTMAVATVFSALALFALAAPLGMFFSGGNKTDGVMLAQTLSILALSTPFLSANFMMSRVFYSYEDAKTPFKIQLWLAVLNVVGATAIQFLPARFIIYAIAALYTVGNILSVVLSGAYLRRRLGHLDGATVARSYIRMGYAASGAALAGGLAVGLLGGLSKDGFIWSSSFAALVSIAVIGVAMLFVYLVLLRIFRVHELRDLLRPLLGRLGARAAATPSSAPARAATDDGGAAAGHPREPEPAYALRDSLPTLSDDTGIIPRISGQFDPGFYRARPPSSGPGTLPGRRTYQGRPGRNPHFPEI